MLGGASVMVVRRLATSISAVKVWCVGEKLMCCLVGVKGVC